jgi:hypothetical protein
MKKLFLILVLCLVWGGNAFAEIITLEKCYENTYKQEFTQRFKGKVYDPSIDESGPNDKVWSVKSYEDYMNNVYEASLKKPFDPYVPKKTEIETKKTKAEKLKRKDDIKITIDMANQTLSFITLSTPIKKQNNKITDYTDGVVFTEREWDEDFGYGNGRLGFERTQVNFLKGFIYDFKRDTRYYSNGAAQTYETTITLMCQPTRKTFKNILGKYLGK